MAVAIVQNPNNNENDHIGDGGALDDETEALALPGLENVLNLPSAVINNSNNNNNNQDAHHNLEVNQHDVEINIDENNAGEESVASDVDNSGFNIGGGQGIGRTMLLVRRPVSQVTARVVAAPVFRQDEGVALEPRQRLALHPNAAPIHHVLNAAVAHVHPVEDGGSSSSSDDDGSESDGSDGSDEDGSSSSGEESVRIVVLG